MKKSGIQGSILCLGLCSFLTGCGNRTELPHNEAEKNNRAEAVIASDCPYLYEKTLNGYEVRLYNKEGMEACLFISPCKPEISEMAEDQYVVYMEDSGKLVMMEMFGYGRFYREYVEIKRNFSSGVPAVKSIMLLEGDKYIAYMEDHENLKVECMFEQQFFAEIKRDFSEEATPGY